jgi:hypothetical protein
LRSSLCKNIFICLPVAQPVILPTQEVEIGRILVQSQPREIVHEILSGKNPSQKRAGSTVQVVERLWALSSNPSTALPPKIFDFLV